MRVRRHGWLLLAASMYLAVGLWMMYPAWLDLEHGVVGDWIHPDMISNHWLYRWVTDQLGQGASILHNDRYYLPVGDAPWLAGNGSDAVPFALLAGWLPWPGSMTLWALLIITLNGLGGLALGRAVGAGRWGATLGGALLAVSPYVAHELGCARYAQAPLYWMAFFLAAWLRLLDAPSLRRGIGAGLLFGAAAFTYWYYGLWMALAGTILFAFRPRWRALLGFVPTALLVTVPPLALFLSHWSEIPGAEEALFPHPLAVQSGLFATFPLWGGTGDLAEITLPLGLIVLALAGWRHLVPWQRRGLLSVAALFYLLSLGPVLLGADGTATALPAPYAWLYGLSDALRRFWWPYRHVAVLTLALVPMAALGADRLRRTGLALVLLAPLGLALRASGLAVPSSWWSAPQVYQDLAALPGDAILELPLAPAITNSQQSLSYQWVHGKRLVNGHAMWVDRVRPDAWDAWVADNSLLAGLQRAEEGTADGSIQVRPADVQALLDQGVRYIVLNSEYFPGQLEGLLPIHNHVLATLFGEPVLNQQGRALVWDLQRYTGVTEAKVDPFSPPTDQLAVDGTFLPKTATTSALGWRPWPRAFPPVSPGDDDARRAAEEAAMPDMLRRKLERRRLRGE